MDEINFFSFRSKALESMGCKLKENTTDLEKHKWSENKAT